MKFKHNTMILWNTTCLTIAAAFEAACQEAVAMTYEPTITSGMDGSHSPESGHYYARSLDFRSKDIPFELRQNVMTTCQDRLGSDYLVILEPTHFHVQKNP